MSKMSQKKILVTGAAGFIGYHLCKRLLNEKYRVTGLDNINDYYNVELKYGRLRELGIDQDSIGKEGKPVHAGEKNEHFSFLKADLSDRKVIENLFRTGEFDVVINLAAQAGVRYSLENPHAYTESNVDGFLNILEGCRHYPVEHLIYASSSSVYGDNSEVPFRTTAQVDQPVSLYAATKRANELMAYTYSHLYRVAATGLRFFTVYGPWGRPDMAYFKFAGLMKAGKPIDVYNHGEMARDFTYIDDIVESIARLIPKPPEQDSENDKPELSSSKAPHHLFNIGNGSPVNLLEFIEILEKALGIKAEKKMMPMQPGDVEKTWADVSDLYEYIDYRPRVDIEQGIEEFVEWYRGYC